LNRFRSTTRERKGQDQQKMFHTDIAPRFAPTGNLTAFASR
jgi:hypothetical protein